MRWLVCLAFVVASVAWTPANAAAGTTGGISGSVVDPENNPLAHVAVTVHSVMGEVVTASDASGFYSFVSLWPGPSYLTISGDGWSGFIAVVVLTDQMRRVDVDAYPKNCICDPFVPAHTLVWPGIADSVWSFGPDGAPQYASHGR